MMPIPIAQYLRRVAPPPSPFDQQAAEAKLALAAHAETERATAVTREREAAYLAGVRDGEAKQAAAFELTLADERRCAEARHAEERARWAAQAGAHFERRVREAFEALEHRLADQTGRVLEPFIEERVRAVALRELRDALAVLRSGGEHAAVRVCGPADLLAAMRETAADSLDGVEFVETEAIDISVVAHDTTIESQLHAWLERLREAVT